MFTNNVKFPMRAHSYGLSGLYDWYDHWQCYWQYQLVSSACFLRSPFIWHEWNKSRNNLQWIILHYHAWLFSSLWYYQPWHVDSTLQSQIQHRRFYSKMAKVPREPEASCNRKQSQIKLILSDLGGTAGLGNGTFGICFVYWSCEWRHRSSQRY